MVWKHLIRIALSLFFVLSLASTALTQPAVTFEDTPGGLYTVSDIGSVQRSYTSRFVPRSQSYSVSLLREIGGVAFTDIASPAFGLQVRSLTLHYNPTKSDGTRFAIELNDQSIQAPLYDWQAVPMVRFVQTPKANSVMTILDRPVDLNEMTFRRRHIGPMFWISFNPAFDNTVAGLNMFIVDSYFVGGRVGQLANIGLMPPVPGYDQSLLNRTRNSAEIKTKIRSILDTQSWTTYIYGDLLTEVTFSISNAGKLTFSSQPGYAFFDTRPSKLRNGEAEARDLLGPGLNSLLVELNPRVFQTAETLVNWTAFFRYAHQRFPKQFQEFANELESKSNVRVSGNVTPRAWRPTLSRSSTVRN